MDFFKRKGKILLTISFCIFIILQQIAVQYRRAYVARVETDANGYDKVASYEINQLEKLWSEAEVEDLVTLDKMGNVKKLESAHSRLKQAEKGIQESEKRVRGLTGEKREFFIKAHAYYRHSASALIHIVDFLLAKQGEYNVKENEISFDSESDAERFRKLIEKLFYIHKEKEELDAFILQHNRDVEKRLLVR